MRVLSEAKAAEVAGRGVNGLVIGADTVVLSGKRLIGKPKTAKEARSLLSAFSGKTILVYTGLYVIDVKKGKSASGIDVSKVHVKRLSRQKQDKFIRMSGLYPIVEFT